MGYERHHAIIVSSFDTERIEAAHAEALSLFGDYVTGIAPGERDALNGHRHFLVCPDGSKEGWAESCEGDERRDKFIAWLEATRYDDGSSVLSWAEVLYADDDGAAAVLRHGDDYRQEPDDA